MEIKLEEKKIREWEDEDIERITKGELKAREAFAEEYEHIKNDLKPTEDYREIPPKEPVTEFEKILHKEISVKPPKRGARTGKHLLDDLDNLEITRKPIVSEFLYERDIFMMSADSGVGKTTITIQLAMCLSSGHPLFEGLETRKARTYVIQVEGDYEESIERMRFMRHRIPVDTDYLCWHENRKLDIGSAEGIRHAIYEIEKSMPEPEVIIIDPIYKLSNKDICTGEGALMVVNFSDALYEKFNCTNILIHHNTKDTTIQDGKKRVEKIDPYYGHSFIKNHIRTSYSLTRDKDTDQPRLTRKKGRGGDTLHNIDLIYDPVTMVCEIAFQDKGTDAIVRITQFLKSKGMMGFKTDFNDVMSNCHVSQAQLRRIKPKIDHLIKIEKEARGKEVWIPLKK